MAEFKQKAIVGNRYHNTEEAASQDSNVTTPVAAPAHHRSTETHRVPTR